MRRDRKNLFRALGLVLAMAGLIVIGAIWPPESRQVHALPKFDPPGLEGGGLITVCEDLPTVPPKITELIGTPQIVGYSVVGFAVEIDARHLKFRGETGVCGTDFVHPVDDFEWSLVSRPAGSLASLTNDNTLAPRLRLDREGDFRVVFTACPHGCTIESGSELIVAALPPIEIPIHAAPSAPLAPETMPVRPAFQATARTPQTRNNCPFDAGVTGSQWFAVEQIDGPADYKLLEGRITKSRVSRKDTPMNHGSQDFTFHVAPDEGFEHLLFQGSEEGQIEVEWETNRFPERYRPTIKDRVSVFGHWIYDCPHDKKTEIHPPVGVAVHRPRPISIPDTHAFTGFGNQTVGSGAYVPGIITDVFFSNLGGSLLDCSVDTGLKNAELTQNGQYTFPTCVPAPSLDRVFEFHIYLPPNPQVTMQRAGFFLPPIPLFVGESIPPNETGGPAPTIERIDTAEGIAYLKVRVDLRGFLGNRYARRIAAGWVLPASDNWGLDRWRLLLHQLNVTNDGDGDLRGDGDWRLWVNTNNASSDWRTPASRQEWVQILNRDVHGVVDFGGTPWETAADAARSLGPDLLRYPPPGPVPSPPDYGILFHTTGYEADGFVDDDAGTISTFLAARPQSYQVQNTCAPSDVPGPILYSGCVSYTADFEVIPGPPLPDAILNPGALALASRYVLSCPFGSSGEVGVCEMIFAPTEKPPVGDLRDIVLEPGSGPVAVTTIGPFRPGEREFALTEISTEDFYQIVRQTQRTDPARLRRLLTSLRGTIDEMRKDPSLALDAYAELDVLRISLPQGLWTRHFGDIRRPPRDPNLPKTRLTGSGLIESGRSVVRMQGLVLHCAPQRLPNRLPLRWGPNRFDLDLVFEARCDPAPTAVGQPSGLRVHEGQGIGRYNGIPGAVVEWSFVDRGEPGRRDSAAVTIRGGAGDILLQVSGDVVRGNLQAHLK